MNNMPIITKNLLIINILIFAATFVAEKYGIDLNNLFALHFFMADGFNPFQLLTYMFMHASFSHIFFNMFALWMFGRILEFVWGPKRFLFYYLVCGIGAGIIQEVVQYVDYSMVLSHYEVVNMGNGITIPMSSYLDSIKTVGASGAVYGILLAYGMLFPNEKMFIFPLPFPIKAKFFIAIFFVIELLQGLSVNDSVAHFAHLGGMIFGFFLILHWKKKGHNGTYHFGA
mgnify:CR=1 FL=1